MGKLTLHARIEIGLATALLLGSCNGAPSYSADDAYDLADVARANSVNALSGLADLEGRLDDLRDTVNNNADAANANRDLWNDNADILNRALDRLDRIERRLGM